MIRLLMAIATLLSAFKKQMNPIHKDSQANYDKHNPDPLRVDIQSEIRLPVAITQHYESEQHDHDRNERRKRLMTCVDIATLCVAAILAFLTWQTLTAVQEQSGIAHEALVSVQRAFVFPRMAMSKGFPDITMEKLESVEFKIPWENSGSTPTRGALNHVSAQVFPGEMPDDFDFPDLGSPKQIPFFIGPKADVISSGMTIHIADIKAVQEGRKRLYLWGWVTYRDVFEGTAPHITKFCHEVTRILVDLTKPRGGGEIIYSHCPRNNCTDEECNKQDQPAKYSATMP